MYYTNYTLHMEKTLDHGNIVPKYLAYRYSK